MLDRQQARQGHAVQIPQGGGLSHEHHGRLDPVELAGDVRDARREIGAGGMEMTGRGSTRGPPAGPRASGGGAAFRSGPLLPASRDFPPRFPGAASALVTRPTRSIRARLPGGWSASISAGSGTSAGRNFGHRARRGRRRPGDPESESGATGQHREQRGGGHHEQHPRVDGAQPRVGHCASGQNQQRHSPALVNCRKGAPQARWHAIPRQIRRTQRCRPSPAKQMVSAWRRVSRDLRHTARARSDAAVRHRR